MSDDRENAICSCICIYNISEKIKINAVSSLHRLCIASTSCYRSYIATKKLKEYEKKNGNTKTFDGKQKRLSVMFHFMFVHYTFSSVWVAEWPPFGKSLPARLAICSNCILSICNIYLV